MKYLLIVIISILPITPLFGQTENLNSLGIEWGRYTERVTEDGVRLTGVITAPAIAFNGLSFWNRQNIGLYTHASFFMPQRGTLTDGITTVSVNYSLLDYYYVYSLSIGLAFREPLTENVTLTGGVGPHVMQSILARNTFDTSAFIWGLNLGVAATASLRYYLSSSFSLQAGVTVHMDLAQYTITTINTFNQAGWVQGFSGFSVRPHIMLGLDTLHGRGRVSQ